VGVGLVADGEPGDRLGHEHQAIVCIECGHRLHPPYHVIDVVKESQRGQVDIPGRSTRRERGHQHATFEHEVRGVS
jgi:hypothetical protein